MPSPLAFGVEITDAATMIKIALYVKQHQNTAWIRLITPTLPLGSSMAEQSVQAPLSPEERDEVWMIL